MFSEWKCPDGISLNWAKLDILSIYSSLPGKQLSIFFFEEFYLTSRYSNLRSLILDISSREVKFGIGGTKFLLIETIIINLNFIVIGFTKVSDGFIPLD